MVASFCLQRSKTRKVQDSARCHLPSFLGVEKAQMAPPDCARTNAQQYQKPTQTMHSQRGVCRRNNPRNTKTRVGRTRPATGHPTASGHPGNLRGSRPREVSRPSSHTAGVGQNPSPPQSEQSRNSSGGTPYIKDVGQILHSERGVTKPCRINSISGKDLF